MRRNISWLVLCAGLLAADAARGQDVGEVVETAPVETVAPNFGSQLETPPRIRSYGFVDALLLGRSNPDLQPLIQTNPAQGDPVPLFDVGSMRFDGEPGWRVTLGYAYDEVHALEVSYLGVHPFEASAGVSDGGEGNSFITRDVLIFIDPNVATEIYDIRYRSEFESYEVNLRRQYRPRWQTLLGFRYMRVDEVLGATTDSGGAFAPFRPISTTTNDLFGMQIGANWQVPVFRSFVFDAGIKLGLGGNRANQYSSTITDDLDTNETRTANTTQFVGFAEFNVSGGWRLRDNVLLYLGYHAIHLDDVALAPDQFLASDFNDDGASGIDNSNNLTYHGLVTGLHFTW